MSSLSVSTGRPARGQLGDQRRVAPGDEPVAAGEPGRAAAADRVRDPRVDHALDHGRGAGERVEREAQRARRAALAAPVVLQRDRAVGEPHGLVLAAEVGGAERPGEEVEALDPRAAAELPVDAPVTADAVDRVEVARGEQDAVAVGLQRVEVDEVVRQLAVDQRPDRGERERRLAGGDVVGAVPRPHELAVRRDLLDLAVEHGGVRRAAEAREVDAVAPHVAHHQRVAVGQDLELVRVGGGADRVERAERAAVERDTLVGRAAPAALGHVADGDTPVGQDAPVLERRDAGAPPHRHAVAVGDDRVAGRRVEHDPLGLRRAVARDRPAGPGSRQAASGVAAAADGEGERLARGERERARRRHRPPRGPCEPARRRRCSRGSPGRRRG